jgi:hypothetical protein
MKQTITFKVSFFWDIAKNSVMTGRRDLYQTVQGDRDRRKTRKLYSPDYRVGMGPVVYVVDVCKVWCNKLVEVNIELTTSICISSSLFSLI